MCIRDRLKSMSQPISQCVGSSTEGAKASALVVTSASYGGGDVYKRQVCAGPRRAGAESGDACRSARSIGKFGRLIRTHRKISAASHSRRRAFIVEKPPAVPEMCIRDRTCTNWVFPAQREARACGAPGCKALACRRAFPKKRCARCSTVCTPVSYTHLRL